MDNHHSHANHANHAKSTAAASGERGTPRRSVATRVLVQAVLFYQYALSPLKMGSSCRFEPTCSAYALDALRHHGAFKGVWLTLIRLAKCGPWHPGGFDPVPGVDPEQ